MFAFDPFCAVRRFWGVSPELGGQLASSVGGAYPVHQAGNAHPNWKHLFQTTCAKWSCKSRGQIPSTHLICWHAMQFEGIIGRNTDYLSMFWLEITLNKEFSFQQQKLCDAVRDRFLQRCILCYAGWCISNQKKEFRHLADVIARTKQWSCALSLLLFETFFFTLFWMRLEDCLSSKWAQSLALWTSYMTTWLCFVHVSFRQVLEQCSRRTVSPQKAELPWLAVNSGFLNRISSKKCNDVNNGNVQQSSKKDSDSGHRRRRRDNKSPSSQMQPLVLSHNIFHSKTVQEGTFK